MEPQDQAKKISDHERVLRANIDLKSLASEEVDRMLSDRRTVVGEVIHNLLRTRGGLMGDIIKIERDLVKKTEMLRKAEEQLHLVNSGDWSVIEKLEKQSKNKEKQSGE